MHFAWTQIDIGTFCHSGCKLTLALFVRTQIDNDVVCFVWMAISIGVFRVEAD